MAASSTPVGSTAVPGGRFVLPIWHWPLVVTLLVISAALAATSLTRDSVTFDETSHLTTGLSYLKTGDFRLAPDHPPLAKIWCAWPLALLDPVWPDADNPHWVSANTFQFARAWLFEQNDGQRFVLIGRCLMVVLLIATCLSVYALAHLSFGPTAGLLALLVAVFSPTFLAHGRLITTDLPITLCIAATLLAFSRLLERVTWPRLILAAAALTTASLTKFSWPLVLPALLAMAVVAIVRKQPIETSVSRRGVEGVVTTGVTRRVERVGLVGGVALFVMLTVWLGIWTGYGWQRTIAAPLPAIANTAAARSNLEQAQQRLAMEWQLALHEPDGTPRTGLVASFLNTVVDYQVFPDAYLLGIAQTLGSTSGRYAYAQGVYSVDGWWWYFPLAFAVKTPLAIIALALAGVIAVGLRRARLGTPLLLTGMVVFVVCYCGHVMSGSFNIGQRHLLPVYPMLFVLAGTAAAWLANKWGRVLVGVAALWLVAANALIFPNYLAYFNETVGGPRHGWKVLADSNIDWGQDLLRLREYQRRHPDESLKLAYFGSVLPTRYINCEALPSFMDFEPRTSLTAGTYVVSVNRLLGLNDPQLRESYWTDEIRNAYQELGVIAASTPQEVEPLDKQLQRRQARREFAELRYKRLLSRLKDRTPDERVGYSLFVYRLTDEDVEELVQP